MSLMVRKCSIMTVRSTHVHHLVTSNAAKHPCSHGRLAWRTLLPLATAPIQVLMLTKRFPTPIIQALPRRIKSIRSQKHGGFMNQNRMRNFLPVAEQGRRIHQPAPSTMAEILTGVQRTAGLLMRLGRVRTDEHLFPHPSRSLSLALQRLQTLPIHLHPSPRQASLVGPGH